MNFEQLQQQPRCDAVRHFAVISGWTCLSRLGKDAVTSNAIATRALLAHTGPRSASLVLRVAAAMAGPAAAPTFKAAVAYEPAIVGASEASYKTRVISVLPTAKETAP